MIPLRWHGVVAIRIPICLIAVRVAIPVVYISPSTSREGGSITPFVVMVVAIAASTAASNVLVNPPSLFLPVCPLVIS